MVYYKKIIFTILCLVLLQISGVGQIKIYGSLGLNIAALKITGVEEVTGYKHRLGKTFGIGFENKVSPKRYIQFQLHYTSKGYKVYQPQGYLSIDYNYLQLQHNQQFSIYKNFHFNLGLYSGILLSQSQEWFRN